ncbi:MAG: AmmeMemoRadiSam system radical SAM enzyme [bacterium]|nr:AmmeMemoRadiSam system radical SAM enzyme [bacterium]
MKEALFYEKLDNEKVKCLLCPKHCVIAPGKSGFCRSRENTGGILYAVNYGQTASHPCLDPIEKKPLYHFYPGSLILSLGANSCNLACENCQNWTISQIDVKTIPVSPKELVALAKENNSLGLAYTYTEPFTWYEFILETAQLIKEAGLKNVIVTNGYVEEEPLKKLLPFIDALNIDIKSMDENFYKNICHAKLGPVLKATELANKTSHVELTNLVIPTLNDKKEDFEKLVNWISEKLGPDTPLHFSRYFPNYKMKIPPTDISSLELARKIAREKLNYVYIGNIADVSANTTYCPNCNNELIRRIGYTIRKIGLKEGKCVKCENKIAGIGL